ncbi:enoyl-CoA hydratase/isomerase family protein [Myroides sp. LJL119]
MSKQIQTSIELTFEQQIATLTFYSSASNSFPSKLLTQLEEQINNLENNKNITTVILRSKGEGAFCAGASFDELLEIRNEKDGEVFFSGFAKVINAIRKSSKIFIARVHGKAVGGGVGIIASCDYSFATDKATIKLSELAIGIGPFVIEPAVSRKIGLSATSEMTLEAHLWKTATWAYKKGLYNQLFDSDQKMDHELCLFAKKIAAYNPMALREMKKIFWQNTDHWDTLLIQRAQISGKLVLSDFTKQALLSFKNK